MNKQQVQRKGRTGERIAKEGLVRGLQRKETGEKIAKEGDWSEDCKGRTGERIAKEGLVRGF